MKVKYAYGKAPGASDIRKRAVCQITLAEENGVAVMVLADPGCRGKYRAACKAGGGGCCEASDRAV